MRSPFDLGAKQMKDISLRILDMECAACVARLERALEKLPGVQRAAVNYTAASALITYDERVTDLAAIAARVKRAGFRVPVEEQDLLPAEADAETAAAAADALRAVFGVKGVAVQADGTLTAYLWPIGVDGRDLAAACADVGCAVTLGELRGGDADQELEKRMDLLKTLVTSACCTAPLMLEMHPKLQFLAGTALQFGPGRYFYKSAWRGLRNRTFGMDFLVSLSSTLIYLYSAYVTFTPRRSYKLYFASDGVLLSLILFGKYMEQVAAGEANSAIRKLMHLQPRTAMVQRGDTFVELPVDQIAEHDRVRIRPGERVPVDGTIIRGSARSTSPCSPVRACRWIRRPATRSSAAASTAPVRPSSRPRRWARRPCSSRSSRSCARPSAKKRPCSALPTRSRAGSCRASSARRR